MHRRVVFVDSSVIITALLSSRGASFYILNNCYYRLRLCINEYVLSEIKEICSTKFKKNKGLISQLFLLIGLAQIEILPNPPRLSVQKLFGSISRNDAPILVSALENCDYLLTLDKEFLNDKVTMVARKKRLIILTPKEFLDIIK